MSYSQENGYIPTSIDAIMTEFMENYNAQFGSNFTMENFVGTSTYKYFYAAAQLLQQDEISTSEIFLKVQGYFDFTNARISRPVVTSPGIVEKLSAEGYIASVKPMIEADAGKINVAVDVDDSDPDYADIKLDICSLLSNMIVGGVVSMGTESEAIVLSNGQSFDFKYHLPDRLTTHLRLTLTLSENNQVVVGNPDDVKIQLLANIAARYRLGRNFEPQRYYSVNDAPWTSNVLLEYSHDAGATWDDVVYDADFDELFEIDLANIQVVEN